MKYRAVYQSKLDKPTFNEVVSAYENDSNVITTTGQKFMVDEIDDLIWKLSSNGVDFSLMWVEEIASRITPNRQEIDISDHPTIPDLKRKVSVYGTNADYTNSRFRYNTLLRHFDDQGNHVVDIVNEVDDVFVSRIVDNSIMVDDGQGGQIGEYNYFFQILESGLYTLIQLENARIPIMDANGIFNDIY